MTINNNRRRFGGRKARGKFDLFLARSLGEKRIGFQANSIRLPRREIAAGVTGLSDRGAEYPQNYATLHFVIFASPHFSLEQLAGTNEGLITFGYGKTSGGMVQKSTGHTEGNRKFLVNYTH